MRRAPGFTLIELMIVLVMVGVLLAIALPAYQQHVRKSVRVEAQAWMQSVATRQQQVLLDSRRYASLDDLQLMLPPSGRVRQDYLIDMPPPGVAPAAFTLTLTPQGTQTLEPCGTLSVSSDGTKTARHNGSAVNNCW